MVTATTDEAAVMVIDDEESIREGCRQTLSAEGYRATVAQDGQRGVALVERDRPDVALVDLKMPGMSGMEVLERIRQIDPEIITIVITGYGTIASAVEAMKAGAFDYLTKPFTPEDIVEVVSRGLEKQRLARSSTELESDRQTALSNFAAVVCQQLSAPAADAAQCLEAVSSGRTGALTDQQKSMLEGASLRIKDVTGVLEDWLALAQAVAGAAELESVDLRAVIQDAWQAVTERDKPERIEFKLKVSETARPVRGNARLLRELFTRLLANSAKFTPPAGTIEVDVAAEDGQTVVSVKDTGVEISSEELPHLFDPFYQGSRAAPEGSDGPGLAIAERIASAHGGTASASSAPGEGTTFAVRLPAEPDMSLTPTAEPPVAPVEAKPPVAVATQALTDRQLKAFVDSMIATRNVVGVKDKEGAEGRFVFGPLERAEELRLDYDVTILPPRKYLMPARETLVRFDLGDSPKAEACVEDIAPTVLVGMHPYDMIATNQLDRLMSDANPDPNYLARREALTVIGIDPARASEKAFWGAVGCDAVEDGFDLWLTDIGGAYVVEVGSEKGAALLAEHAQGRDATDEEIAARAASREALQQIGTVRPVSFRPTELPALLRRCFEHDLWAEQAESCLSCGSCNMVCPTCYCFDVQDEVDISLKSGRRYRAWDGCLLEDFAKVGTGENFREKRLQRYRHRFYRKGMYLYDKYGFIACVGCGRCAAACLPDIADPVNVFNTLQEGTTK